MEVSSMKVARYHTVEDVKYVLQQLPQAVERPRRISPVK